MNLEEKVKLLIALIIVVAFFGAFFDLSESITYWIINLLISMVIGVILSGIAEKIIETFTGDYLKRILIPIKLFGFKFSISLFLIATIIVRFLIFRM